MNKKELIRILKDCKLCVNMAKGYFIENKIEFYLSNLQSDIDDQIKKLGGAKNGSRKNKN